MSLDGTYDPDNVFAKILRGEIPSAKVFEDAEVLVLMDAFPQARGHMLVISKTSKARNLLEAQATRVERIEDDLRELLPGVRVTSVRAEGIDDFEQPVRLTYEATVPTIGTRQGDTVLLYGASPVQLTRRFATRSTRSDLVAPA